MRIALRGFQLHCRTVRHSFGLQAFRSLRYRNFATRSTGSKRDQFYSESTFNDFALAPILSNALTSAGYNQPSQIQGLGIDSILEGNDVLLAAETGSGKTLAYLLPILTKILQEKAKLRTPELEDDVQEKTAFIKRSADFALVLCPTLDLCHQVQSVLKSLDLENEPIEVEISPGGFSRYKQRPDVLVGTPGSVLTTLLDMGKNTANRILIHVGYVVIDEADIMLAGSYRPQIDRLLQMMKAGEREVAIRSISTQLGLSKESFLALPRHIKRAALENGIQGMIESGYDASNANLEKNLGSFWRKQFILAGATIPSVGTKNIKDEIQELFPNVEIISTSNLHKTGDQLVYHWIEVSDQDRLEALIDTITKDEEFQDGEKGKILVFSKDSITTELTARYLLDHGVNCVSYHKKLQGATRSSNLERFRVEKGIVMVSTDGMSRGMDIPDITHLIQCDFAPSAITFVHRVGRTGRAGRSGKVTSFCTEDDKNLVEAIRDCMEQGIPIEGAFSRNRSFRKKFRRYGKFVPRGKTSTPSSKGKGNIQEGVGCTELECPI
eukprot:g3816.t1